MTAGASTHLPMVLSGEDGSPTNPGPVALSPSDRVLVTFTAQDCGVAPMTWGQFDMWRAMVGQNNWLPLGGTQRLEPGTRLEDVVEELRYLMTRFPSLRTRLRFGDGDRPVQVLFDSGQITLELFDATATGDADGTGEATDDAPERTAAAIEAQYRRTAFHFADHWPLRMALVLDHGVPTHMVALICHLALDAAGAQVMLREAAQRRTAPCAGLQPLDQARWQSSPAGLRQNAAALRHWESLIRSAPTRRIGGLDAPRQPVRWCAQFTSPALQLGVRAIAARVAVDSSVVLLVLYATALARITGVNPVVTRPLVSNRFRPGLADVVCTAVQGGILALDVADATVDEAIRRAQRSVMIASKHAYYDPEQLDDMIARVTRELPGDFEIRCFFNDRRSLQQNTASAAHDQITPLALHEARDRGVLRWTEKTDQDRDENMFVHIDEDPTGIVLTVCAHTGYFSPERIEALAHGMEHVAIAAALNPAEPTLMSTTPPDHHRFGA